MKRCIRENSKNNRGSVAGVCFAKTIRPGYPTFIVFECRPSS